MADDYTILPSFIAKGQIVKLSKEATGRPNDQWFVIEEVKLTQEHSPRYNNIQLTCRSLGNNELVEVQYNAIIGWRFVTYDEAEGITTVNVGVKITSYEISSYSDRSQGTKT